MERTDPFRILVVDDDELTREAHARLARRLGHTVDTAPDGIAALGMLPLGFDLVLLDAEMPHMDGFEVAERIRAEEEHRFLSIVMVTGLVEPHYRRRAMEIGINDFLNKPVDPDELALKAKWLLSLKRSHDLLEDQAERLEREVAARTAELRRSLHRMAEAERRTRRAHTDTIRRLMIAAEYKDQCTAGHIERIGRYSEIVAKAMGVPPGTVDLIRHAAPMHDVGKIGIPDHVLLKPGSLDDDEWVVMRSHTTIGRGILAGSDSPLLQMGERIAASHHEWWDGSGYPLGLSGEEIPLESRICTVVDFYDALTTDRPYRPAVPVDDVVGMMKEEEGRHFDPKVLDAFFGVLPQVASISVAQA